MKIPLAILCVLILLYDARAQEPDAVKLRLLIRQCHADSLRGDYLSALQHWNQYRILQNSALELMKKKQAAELEKQYQTKKKDLEIKTREKNIALLNDQNTLNEKLIIQSRLILTIIIAVGCAIALLLAASLWQFRQKILANHCLQQQQYAIDGQIQDLEAVSVLKDNLLEDKEVLIKEIHHRVKNNLQVVISLLNTQSAYLNDPQTAAAMRQSQHRMQSISLIHQKLYQSESRALINFREYTQELVQYLRQSFNTGSRIAFHLHIADVDIDVLKAVPLGLILNETISNAMLHAFAADQQGDINLNLAYQPTGGLQLLISDKGRGMPPGFSLELCESLGINLVKDMCREIGASLEFQQHPGSTFSIEMPPSNGDISSFDGELKSLHIL